MARKAIITCAITGGIHTPSMSPYLPITPDQIAEAAIAAAEAGAAIIHLHARRPEPDDMYGFPDWRPETYMAFLPRIKQRCDAIINITTGGGPGMTFEERMAGPTAASPEITSFNLGCVNFGLFSVLEKMPAIQYPWERMVLAGSKDRAYVNSFAMMEAVGRFGKEHNVRFEFECFDIGHLYALKLCRDEGWLPEGPLFIQAVLGVPGGLPGEPQHVVHMFDTARRLFGEDTHLSALGAGRWQMRVAAVSAAMGCHVRVGLEDSLALGKGGLAVSNADQVRRVRRILEDLSIDIATPEEARQMLGAKGADRVGF